MFLCRQHAESLKLLIESRHRMILQRVIKKFVPTVEKYVPVDQAEGKQDIGSEHQPGDSALVGLPIGTV